VRSLELYTAGKENGGLHDNGRSGCFVIYLALLLRPRSDIHAYSAAQGVQVTAFLSRSIHLLLSIQVSYVPQSSFFIILRVSFFVCYSLGVMRPVAGDVRGATGGRRRARLVRSARSAFHRTTGWFIVSMFSPLTSSLLQSL
jgi:hypothetical protein